MSLIAGGTNSGNRPGCWSNANVYDNQSRECRGCGFQSSCREQVIKQTMNNQPSVPNVSTIPSYYSQFPQQSVPFATPSPVAPPMPPPMFGPPQPQQPTVMKFTAPPPPAPQQMQMQPQMYAPQQMQQMPQQPMQQQMRPMSPQPQPFQHQVSMGSQDFYGRVQDPLFFALMQPPPFRPQMDGETFMERFGKNLMLDLGAMACFHLGLALRQMFLPPQPAQPLQPPERVVNGP